jgi:16S rRNA (guanine966-N2)-methyltransferase
MRIGGGEARGRTIRLPRGCRIRPTADRIKESLFGIIAPVAGVAFLDLFAGSGAVGLEALSRGARLAVFVERDNRLADAIRTNLSLLGYAGKGEVVASDAALGLRRLANRGDRFEIIFADPPYEDGYLKVIFRWLEGANVLAEGGLLALQHSVREAVDPAYARAMVTRDQRRYGDTLLSFLREA